MTDTTTVSVVDADATVVQVVDGDATVVEVADAATTVIATAAIGPRGPQGEQGPTGPQGPPGEQTTYTHIQATPAAVWTITHNLNRYPAVTVVDSAGETVVGDLVYVDSNTVTVTFTGAFSGRAYLN